MVDLFQDKIATTHRHSQNFWMAELGLKREDAFYTVIADHYDEGGLVTIQEQGRTIYTAEFKETSSVTAFAALMNEEVGYWDAYEYYSGDSIDRQARQDYEATELAAIRSAWA